MAKSQEKVTATKEPVGTDKLGKELFIGDTVMYPVVVHSKGCRGGVSFGVVEKKSGGSLALSGEYRAIRDKSVTKVSVNFARAFEDGSLFDI